MTTKEYLQQIWKLKNRIDQCIEQLDELKSYGAKAIDYSAVHVQTSPTNQMEILAIQMSEEEFRLNNLIRKYIRQKQEIIQQINSLPDERHVVILYKRYVENKTLNVIATEMHYDYYWVCKLHGYALIAFDKQILQAHNKTQKGM